MRELIKVFKNKNYLLLTIITTILFYSLNAIISSFLEIISFYKSYSFLNSLKLTFLNILGFHYKILVSSLISLIIISILLGILVSLLTYKTKKIKQNENLGFFAAAGIFIGIIAPGCAACGIGMASILGFSAFLTFLPFKGLELSILSIILLLIANYQLSKTLLNDDSCKIKLPKEKTERR